VETVLYRVVQESLTNVAKHARASRVSIHLVDQGDGVTLDARDDGVGFEPARASGLLRAAHFGLAGSASGSALVGEADEGLAGVELATRLEPDVVLMDLRLPGISGLEATRQIKQLCPAVQVLILTAYDDPELDREAIAVGASAFLVKGCQVQRICQLTDQAWAHARTLAVTPPLTHT
jgi:CheY-like chemotaxis protein